ncbi:MAG: hypothetical protein WKF87_06750 [Chryseolinea sp.]
MITTLATTAERIIRRLSGGDIPSDSPYKMEFVIEDVRDALRADLKLELLERRSGQEDDRTPITQYIATYFNIPVILEAATNRTYIEIPSNYMSLKHNKGIHWVASMRTPTRKMIPIANPSVTMNLPHGDLERGNHGYYVEGMKIYSMRNLLTDKGSKLLLKLLVPAPDTWSQDDPLPVLPENISRVMDIVVGRMSNPKVPQERLNDGNPNYRIANG